MNPKQWEARLKRLREEGAEESYIEDGAEFEEERKPKKIEAKTELQQRILNVMGLRYFPREKGVTMRHRLAIIEKSIGPIDGGPCHYPTEWVESCLGWFSKKYKVGVPIPLPALLNLIEDEDALKLFRDKWRREHAKQ